MKHLNSVHKYFYILTVLALVSIFTFTSCTEKFEEINSKPSGLKVLAPSDLRSLFPNAQYETFTQNTGYTWQTMTMLFAGMYSQQFAGIRTTQESHRYVIVQRWMDIWPRTYVNTMPSLYTIIEQTKENEPTLNAVARIWRVESLHRLSDYFGPIPYSKIGIDSTVVKYDSQKDIYYDFFKELDEAAEALKNNIDKLSFEDKDLIYQGDNMKWLKFANSLRLRLALRISLVEPEKAKMEAEKAFAGGVMLLPEDGAYFATSNVFPHGLNAHDSRQSTCMSQTMESLLKGYNDPRLEIYWLPAASDGVYRGVRNGMSVAEQNMPVHSAANNSQPGPPYRPELKDITPMVCMYASEVYFLRAEGALNGWNMGGAAKELYEEGIKTSMEEHGITDAATIDAYINGTSLPMAPGGFFDTPALSDIPVQFLSSEEKQREQIGTQKWLALFPEPHEAWAEIRRTGYPKFYPLIHSQNPNIEPDRMIRRISFLDREKIANGAAVEAAVPLLGGGPDQVGTPLWWDIHP